MRPLVHVSQWLLLPVISVVTCLSVSPQPAPELHEGRAHPVLPTALSSGARST